MNNAVFINALDLTPYAFENIPGIGSSFDAVVKAVSQYPDVGKIYVLAGNSFNSEGPFKVIKSTAKSMAGLLSVIKDAGRDFDNIYYVYGDTPLLDPDIAERMYKNHLSYFATYTFADGYPYGLSPEIVKTEVLSQILTLAEKEKISVTRGGFFEVIQKDINSFDIETEISPKDQRMLRVSLSADSKRNYNQLKRIIAAGGRDETSVAEILETRQDLLRTEPAFVNVQITGGCLQACSYCPYPGMVDDVTANREIMTIDKWQIILDKVHAFSQDAVFSVSLWGEPSLHPDITSIIRKTLEVPEFSLIIETSGLGWDRKVIDEIKAADDGRLTWIVSLDSENPDNYEVLRGDGWNSVMDMIEYTAPVFMDNFYIQSVRMKKNEEYLEKFYRGWKARGIKTIIQKYDSFCGVLPNEKVTDISPVKRFPCWHIKRDLVILLDGSVQLCREDISSSHILGNIFSDDLPQIWENGTPYFLKHIEEEYPEICRKCDEYYTYNF